MTADDRLLRVEAPHFVAGAIWRRGPSGRWVCVHAAPIIGWMLLKDASQTGRYLNRKRWKYEWL